MLRILLICTGNTCRSPMAEAMLRQKIRNAGQEEKIKVLSAGLSGYGEVPASEAARAVMRGCGLDIDSHRSRQIAQEFVTAADLILTMTQRHKTELVTIFPEAADKTWTLAQYAGTEGDVADPFGGTVATYRACAGQLEDLLRKVWEKIVVWAGEKAETEKTK